MHASDRSRQAKRSSLWLSQHVHCSSKTLARWMVLPSLTIWPLSLLNVLVEMELLPELQFTSLDSAAPLPFIWTKNSQDKTHQNGCDTLNYRNHPALFLAWRLDMKCLNRNKAIRIDFFDTQSWLTKGHSGGSASLRATGGAMGWLLGIGSVGAAFRNKQKNNQIASCSPPNILGTQVKCDELYWVWLPVTLKTEKTMYTQCILSTLSGPTPCNSPLHSACATLC